MSKPLVSAILPAYNPEKDWFIKAIESVQNQTYDNLELVVVDDGSDRPVKEILDQQILDKDSVKLERQENRGQPEATNRCVDLSSGEYIAIIHQDDIWKKNKIEAQVEKAQQEEAEMVFSKAEIIDSEGRVTGSTGEFPQENYYDELLISGCYPCLTTAFIKTRVLTDYEIDNSYKIALDEDLWLRTFDKYSVSYLDECLAQKRIHPSSISGSKEVAGWRETEELRKQHLKDRGFYFRRKCLSNFYRQKGKASLLLGRTSVRPEKFFWEAIKQNPLDYKNYILFITSFSPELTKKMISAYKRIA